MKLFLHFSLITQERKFFFTFVVFCSKINVSKHGLRAKFHSQFFFASSFHPSFTTYFTPIFFLNNFVIFILCFSHGNRKAANNREDWQQCYIIVGPQQCNWILQLIGLHRRYVWEKLNRGLGADGDPSTEHDLPSAWTVNRCFLLLCCTCWKFSWHVRTEPIVGTNYNRSGKRNENPFYK